MSQAYSLLPIEVVMQLVADLHNTRSTIYSMIKTIDNEKKLFMIWKIQDHYTDYLIAQTPFVPTPQDIISAEDFRFYGVNFDEDGTLLQCMLMNNIVSVPITTIRTFLTLAFRGEKYNLTFDVYQNGSIVEQKESLCHLFCFPSFTFVYYGTIVLQFTLIEFFPVLTYIGRLNHSTRTIESFMTYDYANGNLMGILQSQLLYFWNDKSFALLNHFPDLASVVYTSAGPIPRSLSVLIGGQNVFGLETRPPTSGKSSFTEEDYQIIRKCTTSYNDTFYANEPTGGKLQFTSLKEFILIQEPSTILSPRSMKYITAFTSLKTLTTYPYYAVIGESQFADTQTKVRTYPLRVEFSQTYDPATWQSYESIWFLYTGSKLFIYEPGFENWRRLNAGNINVNDLRPALLQPTNTQTSFDSLQNTTPSLNKMIPSTDQFEFPLTPSPEKGGSIRSTMSTSGISSL